MSGWSTTYRAARSFKVGGRNGHREPAWVLTVVKGEVLRADDSIVERVLADRRTDSDSRRPTIEVAGVRAYVQGDDVATRHGQRPKPTRDWLTEPPPWRLP
jgi:hypothetical protein